MALTKIQQPLLPPEVIFATNWVLTTGVNLSSVTSSILSLSANVATKFGFTPTVTTSAFTLTGINLSTNVNNYRVDIDGVLQEPGVDYYLSGSNIIFTTSISAGEKVVVVGNQPVGTFDPSFSPVIATGTTTPRTLQNRFADVVSVKDFGAVGDGVTDDSAAFAAAAYAVITSDSISNNWGIQFPQRGNIYVPAGSYLLTTVVDTSGKEITWHCAHGAEFLPLPQTGLSRLNGRLVRDGIHFSAYQFGIKDPATTLSIKGNPLEYHDEGAYVNAFAEPYQLADVSARDCCTLVVDNRNIDPTANIVSANYTSTTILPGTPLTTDQVKKLRVGMVIDTKHTPIKYSGFITGWAANGSSITVSGWFATGNQSSGQVPSNGVGAYVNNFTKIFAQNSLVWLTSGLGRAEECAGFELDIHNNRGPVDTTDVNGLTGMNYAWGFDCSNAGTYNATVAYLTRGRFKTAFHALGTSQVGNEGGSQEVGFRYNGDGLGFFYQNLTSNGSTALRVLSGGTETAALYTDGNMRCNSTARAWVNFNGDDSTIRSEFNVKQIDKLSTGRYKVVFTTPMVNTFYCTVGSFNDLGSGASTFSTSNWELSAVTVTLTRPGSGFYDHGIVNVTVFGNAF